MKIDCQWTFCCVIIMVEDNDMNSRQWNLMIRMVNDGDSREKVKKFFSGKDLEKFDNMRAQLARERKKNPKAAFYPVETDW